MNAHTSPLKPSDRLTEPSFAHHSRFEWGVLLYGGLDRRGFLNPPLEFCLPACHYSRERIEQRAADLAELHKRPFWVIQEPSGGAFGLGER